MAKVVDGSCLCGGVRFKVTLPVKWVAHCHCSMCRKAHGAAFVTWAGSVDDNVEVSGVDNVARFASSPSTSREHCRLCGSPLFFRGERWPGEVHIARALLGDIDKEPVAHVFYSDRVAWVHTDDGLAKRGGDTGVEDLGPAVWAAKPVSS